MRNKEKGNNLPQAVALRYTPQEDRAPKVTAKGSGRVAEKIIALAKEHGIPFYVAAPSSTIDLAMASGKEIVIEERKAEEITCGYGKRTAPENIPVFNPAFDVTPAKYVTAIITEKGAVTAPFEPGITQLFKD